MTSPPALLDTDTLSLIMRQQPIVVAQAQAYLATQGQFAISIITRYEILRGLKVKNATTQMLAFDRFCGASIILPLSEKVVLRAADIYADLYQKGLLVGDADVLIAATAIEAGRTLVTNNTRHFSRIIGLALDNWNVP